MPIWAKKPDSFHLTCEDIIKNLKKYKKDKIILSYGLTPEPHASLYVENSAPKKLPLPKTPAPYKDWNSFFRYFMEPELIKLARVNRTGLYVLTNKDKLIPLWEGKVSV